MAAHRQICILHTENILAQGLVGWIGGCNHGQQPWSWAASIHGLAFTFSP